MLDVQLAHDGTDPVRDLPGSLVVDVIKDDRELLAAVACQDIHGPTDYFLNSLGDLAQGEIAGLVSVKVVVGFEVIDVDQQDRQCAPIDDRPLPQQLEVLIEDAAIFGSCQGVALGQLGNEPSLEKRLPRDLLKMQDGHDAGRDATGQEHV